jgi:tetratricopeptide (TPR) repeat protein
LKPAVGGNHFRGANVHFNESRFLQAKELYLEVVKLVPDHVESLKRIADIMYNEAQFEEGIDAKMMYEESRLYFLKTIEAIQSIPDWQSYSNAQRTISFEDMKNDAELKVQSVWVRVFNIGNALFGEEDFESAVPFFLYLIEIDPKRTEAYFRLISCFDRLEDTERKLEYSMKLLEASEGDIRIIMNIGIQYRDANDWENALKYFNMAIEADPANVSALLELAFVDVQVGDFADALEKTEKAFSIENTNIEILLNIIEYAQRLNNLEKSIHYQKILFGFEETSENARYLCYDLSRAGDWTQLKHYALIWHRIDPTDKEPVIFIITAARSLNDTATVREYEAILVRMQ